MFFSLLYRWQGWNEELCELKILFILIFGSSANNLLNFIRTKNSTILEAMRHVFNSKLSKDLMRGYEFLNPLLKPTKSSEPTYQLILNSTPDVKSCGQYFDPHVNHNQDPQNETSSMNWIKCEGAHVYSDPKKRANRVGPRGAGRLKIHDLKDSHVHARIHAFIC